MHHAPFSFLPSLLRSRAGMVVCNRVHRTFPPLCGTARTGSGIGDPSLADHRQQIPCSVSRARSETRDKAGRKPACQGRCVGRKEPRRRRFEARKGEREAVRSAAASPSKSAAHLLGRFATDTNPSLSCAVFRLEPGRPANLSAPFFQPGRERWTPGLGDSGFRHNSISTGLLTTLAPLIKKSTPTEPWACDDSLTAPTFPLQSWGFRYALAEGSYRQ
jgi:hypothetical protein